MPAELVVHLNSDGPHSIDISDQSFEATDSFDIVLKNHGSALHVYLELDDDLSEAASVVSANQYVEAERTERIPVQVSGGSRPVEGRLKLVTGYGTETAYAKIRITEPVTEDEGVRVDESLAQPQPTRDEPLLAPDALPVVVLAAIAMLVAVLAVLIIDGIFVLVGVGVVLVGIVIAGVFLLQ